MQKNMLNDQYVRFEDAKEAQDMNQPLQIEDPQGSKCSNTCWKHMCGGGDLISPFLGVMQMLIFQSKQK